MRACAQITRTRPTSRNGGHAARLTEGGLELVVSDIRAAHTHLVERGVDVSEVQVYDSGGFQPSREGDVLDNVGFVYFSDPDGNGSAVQQISGRG